MANSWLRLWHDMPNDPKWRTIARASGQPITTVISVYVHLLVEASVNATERGRTQPNAEDLASALDVETESITAVLSAMEGRVIDAGRLTGWSHRQPEKEDGSADRARVWREKQKELKTKVNATERDRTTANTDKDKDKEEIRTKAAKGKPLPFVLPEWISKEVWSDFEAMRKAQRAPLTDRARANIVAALVQLEAAGQQAEDVLNQSITNSWRGVFPLKENTGRANEAPHGANKPSPAKQRVDANRAALAEAIKRRGLDGVIDAGRPDGVEIPQSGSDGFDGGVPAGFRASGPEILSPAISGGAGRAAHQARPGVLSTP